MYTPLPFGPQVRRLALGVAGLLGFGTVAQAQSLNYTTTGATNVAGTFTAITTGTLIIPANTDDANSTAQNIGFTFGYNGATFTQFVLNTNGLIRLGSAAPSAANMFQNYEAGAIVGVDPISSTSAADVNLLMPFNFDLIAGTSAAEYRVLTSGTAGSRVCTIQWKNVSDKADASPTQYSNFTFQLKLYETSNRIEFVYGTASASANTATARFPTVGIKGSGSASGQDVLANKTSSSAAWSTTVFITGVYSTSTHNFRSTVGPDLGRTYRFDPTTGTDAALSALYTLGQLSQTYATPHVARAVVANLGATALTNVPVVLTVTGANSFTNTQTIASLAAGASATVTFAGYSTPNLGLNTVTATVNATGDVTAANNSASSGQNVSVGRLAYTNPSQTTFDGGIGTNALANSVLLAKFTTTGAANLTAITPTFNAAGTAGDTYQVQVYAATGTGTPGAVLYTSAARPVPTAAGPDPVTIPALAVNGSFFIATKQLAVNNIGLAYQTENPLRTGTFYYSTDGTTFTDAATLVSAGLQPRLALEATLSATATSCAAVTGLAAGTITNTTANLTFTAAAGATNYTVTYTPTGGTTTTRTVTASPVALTGLTAGTTYSVSLATNCSNGQVSAPVTTTFTTTGGAAAPANDLCSGAITVTCGQTVTGTTVGATLTGDPTTVCAATTLVPSASPGVFYRFVGNGQVVTLSTCSGPTATTGDTELFVYTGTCANLTCVASDDDGSATCANIRASELSFNSVNGTTYYVMVQFFTATGTTAVTGAFGLNVTCAAAPVAPANDDCASAITLTSAVACNPTSGTTVGATQSLAPILCNNFTAPSAEDVWYKFVATGTTNTVTVAGGTAFDPVIDVRSGACNGANIACSDATFGSASTEVLNLTGLTLGTTYYVRVYSYIDATATPPTTTGTFTICVTGGATSTAPANDNCTAATTLTPGSTCVPTSGTTVGATQSIAPILCGGFTAPSAEDVWYKFVATSTTHTVTVVGGTTFDAVIDVRSGACNGANIACADATVVGGTESVTLTGLTPTSTYYVRVYSFIDATSTPPSTTGTFTICVTGGGTALDAGVAALYTQGQISQTLASPHVVRAVVFNNGTTALTNVPVTLTVSGANTFTNTQTVASLAVGASTTVTFAGYPLTNLGTNTLTVTASVTGDGFATNNTQTYTQVVSAGRMAYVDGTQPLNATGVGVGAANGVLAVRYTVTQPGLVTSITPTFQGAGTAGTTYQVRLYDATGTGGTPGAILYTSATQTRPTATGPVTIAVPNIQVSGDFFVATVELDANNLGLAYQVEDPLRPNTFYYQASGGAFTLINTTALRTRLALEVNLAPLPCNAVTNLAAGSITATSAQLTFTPPTAGSTATNYTVTITPTGGTATTQTATASPVSLTGLTASTSYTVTVRTNCASGQNSVVATVTFTTLAPPCPAITNLTSSNVAATTATLTFTPAAGATGYTVTYTPQGGATTTQPVTGSPVSLTGLTASTVYNVTVTTNCAAGQNSPAVTTTFTTTAPPCPVVTGVATSNVAATTATLSFTAAAGATSYAVTLTPQGGTTTTQTVVGSPLSLTGLTPNTAYAVCVTASCGAGGSSATSSCVNFTTTAPPCLAVTNLAASGVTTTTATLTFTPAAGATGYTVTYTPQGGATTTQPATGSPVNLAGLTAGTQYAVTVTTNCAAGQTSPVATTTFNTSNPACPAVTNLVAGSVTTTGATLTFTAAAGATGYIVTYTPQGGTASTQTATGSPVVLVGLTPGTQYTATVATTCAAGQSSSAVATTFTTVTPPCPAVTNAAVSSITTTGASVSFTPAAGATGYTLTITPAGGTATTQTATGSPVTLTGLTPATAYTVAITTNCAAGQTSPAASVSFTTATPCLPVTNLTAGSITPTGATLTFTAPAAGATGFTITYTAVGGIAQTQTSTGSPVVLVGLTPGTQYTATVTTNCGAGQTSTVATTTFTTTLPPCLAVTGLTAGTITTTGATLTFTAPAGATSFTITYTAAGGPAQTQTANGSPVTLTGLTPGTVYNVSVVTNCGAGQTSPPATTTFTTATPPCLAPTTLTVSNITTATASIAVTPAAGSTATSYTVTVTPAGGPTTTQTVTSTPILLNSLLPGTVYTVTVAAICGPGQTSPATTTTFTTTAPCLAATGLAAANVAATTATLNFTAPAGATNYTLTVTPQGGTAATQTATASPVSLTGLLAGTAYTVSVVTNCGAGQTSPAATTTFTTTAPAPTAGAAGSVTNNGASITFTGAPGATSYTVTYTPAGGTPVTVTVPAAPAALTGLTPNTAYTVTIVANYPGGAASAPLTVSFTTLMGTATRTALAGGQVLVYPNPAHHAFTLSLPALGTARTARLELVNALGQVVRVQTLTLTSGGTQVQVPVADLATGIYSVRVQAGAESATTRLTVE